MGGAMKVDKPEEEQQQAEMMLNEIPHAAPPHTHHHHSSSHHHHPQESPVLTAAHGVDALTAELQPRLDGRSNTSSCTHAYEYVNGSAPEGSLCRTTLERAAGDVDRLGLVERLSAMSIGYAVYAPQDGCSAAALRSPLDEDCVPSRCACLATSLLSDDSRRPSIPDSQQHCFSHANLFDSYSRGTHRFDPRIVEALSQSEQHAFARNQNWNASNSLSSLQSLPPRQNYDSPAMNGRAAAFPRSLHPVQMPRNIEAFGCDGRQNYDSPAMNGSAAAFPRSLHSVQMPRNIEAFSCDGCSAMQGMAVCYTGRESKDFEVSIYDIARDDNGGRFLQRKLEEGTLQEVEMIFNGIIDHVTELMVDRFGNYLLQKMLDKCSEEQRTRILLVLTEDPTALVRISRDSHGTRVVQKLIETLGTQQQRGLLVSVLRPGFLDLIMDSNGNHVVQCCLKSLAPRDNKFIFDAAAKRCVEIATHQHGCCVLQCCIAHSTGEHRANLIARISANGLLLAQDTFGNYVVQYILDLKNPLATATLISQFKGNYVHLSVQKFSSNVVEKCLKVFTEDDKGQIIIELLSVSHFEELLQDPYANYVIQTALENCKGHLLSALVQAIRPHAAALRTSPYCKRIFSRILFRK